MTNNEKFNKLINECENPGLILSALLTLAPVIRTAKNEENRAALLDTLRGDETA